MKELQQELHALAREKGWWESGTGPEQLAVKLALVHSELSEALECLRDGQMEVYQKDGKPEGWPIELADTFIRLFDLAEATGVDVAKMISVKTKYNQTRAHRHGGRAL